MIRCGLQSHLAVRRAAGGIEGIVNGMDTDDWCPTVDKFLDVKYDERTVAHGKAAAKETLQAELGLPVRDWRHTRLCNTSPGDTVPHCDLLGMQARQRQSQRGDSLMPACE